MTTDQSIFKDQNQPSGDLTQNPPGNQAPGNVQPDQALLTLLSEIKNERGEPKYKSLPDALNALKHSQEFIPQLNQQIEALKGELDTAKASSSKIAELESAVAALTRQPNNEGTPPALSEEQIAEIVRSQMSAAQKRELDAKNQQSVAGELVKLVSGDVVKAKEQYASKAAELGMTEAELNSLAARSPKAVLLMFGIKESVITPPPNNPSHTGVNTTGLQPHQDTFIKRNDRSIMLGATGHEVVEEARKSGKLIEELESKGMSLDDLTNPKNFFKHFGHI